MEVGSAVPTDEWVLLLSKTLVQTKAKLASSEFERERMKLRIRMLEKNQECETSSPHPTSSLYRAQHPYFFYTFVPHVNYRQCSAATTSAGAPAFLLGVFSLFQLWYAPLSFFSSVWPARIYIVVARTLSLQTARTPAPSLSQPRSK